MPVRSSPDANRSWSLRPIWPGFLPIGQCGELFVSESPWSPGCGFVLHLLHISLRLLFLCSGPKHRADNGARYRRKQSVVLHLCGWVPLLNWMSGTVGSFHLSDNGSWCWDWNWSDRNNTPGNQQWLLRNRMSRSDRSHLHFPFLILRWRGLHRPVYQSGVLRAIYSRPVLLTGRVCMTDKEEIKERTARNSPVLRRCWPGGPTFSLHRFFRWKPSIRPGIPSLALRSFLL